MNILKYIETYGYEAYFIGGYPRDKYLGLKTEDYDICTNARPDELEKLFDCDTKNSVFGNVNVIYENKKYEITTFRRDSDYKNNRIPTKISFVNDLKTDLKRRDFTINTLAIDSDGNYIDLMGAIKDIESHKIKAVGNSDKKIMEDALRILRAIRFAADLDFNIDIDLEKSIIKYKDLLNNLSSYQINKEITKIKNKTKARELFDKYNIDVHC